MSATVVVASYAALVSTGTLVWTVYRERRRLATSVDVEFGHAPKPMKAWQPSRYEYELTLSAINRGESTEHVVAMRIESAHEAAALELPVEAAGELAPRRRVSSSIRLEYTDFAFAGGFVGVVELASGETITSPIEHLDNGLLEHVRHAVI